VSWKIDGQKMWFWVLDGYEEWCKKAINEFCKICQIDNFYDWLKSDVQVVKDESKKSSIEKEFKKYLWRGTKPDEFVPYLPWIELLYKRIARIKEEMWTIQKIKKWGTN